MFIQPNRFFLGFFPFLSFSLLLTTPLPSSTEDSVTNEDLATNEELLSRAENAFAKGLAHQHDPDRAIAHFRKAAQVYEKLLQRGIHNADLYRNLGQAHFLGDCLPQAILAWRMGLQIAPEDAEIQAHLAYARGLVDYPTDQLAHPPRDDWPPGIPHPTPRRLWGGFVLFYLLTCLAGTRWLMVRRWEWLATSGVFLGISLGFLGGLGWIAHQKKEILEHPVVVISVKQTGFYQGNGESYPLHKNVPYLYRGMEGRLLFERKSWLQIELASGQVGWIPRSSALISKRLNFSESDVIR